MALENAPSSNAEILSSRRELYRDGDYVVEHEYETAYLRWPGGECEIGYHYGDPSCAVVNVANGWCLTGGEGLLICHFAGGLPAGSEKVDRARITQVALWRGGECGPPPSFCAIEGAWLYQDNLVRVLLDPIGPHAGLYEVDVRTQQIRRL